MKPKSSFISLSEFKKLDLRIGKVISAERIPDTENLIKLEVDVGDSVRQVVVGMAKFYDVNYFLGKKMLILVNLEPRKYKDILNGMILAVDVEGKPILLQPEKDVPVGTIVR